VKPTKYLSFEPRSYTLVTALINQNQMSSATAQTIKYTAPQQLEIMSWQSFARTLKSPASLERLELFLLTSQRSFLCSFQRISVADTAVASAIVDASSDIMLDAAAKLPELRRWLRTVLTCMDQPIPQNLCIAPLVTLLPIPASVGLVSSSKEKSAPIPALEQTEIVKTKDEKEKPKENSGDRPKGSLAPPVTGAASADGDEALDPSKLDLRVGLITKCWNHPEADKLLCEEIDLGESTGPRSIASGLRAHYTAEAIVGRKVIVVANLKEAKLVGFKSNGMVLCACSADRSIIKLLEAPVDAQPGERVVFEGFTGEAASSSVMAKKKVLEKLAPGVLREANDSNINYHNKI